MPLDRFYIGPPQTGLQTNVKPYAIADDAYERLRNANVFRSQTKKRLGAGLLPYGNTTDQLKSRFRVKLAVATDGAGNVTTAVPLSGGVPIVTPAVGQMFSIGSEIFTVNVVTPIAAEVMLHTGSATTFTFDTRPAGIGTLTIVNSVALSDVYYYPALPVIGLRTRETTTKNDEQLVGFDTRFAYERVAGGWERLKVIPAAAGDAQWTGTSSDFMWTTNYHGALSSDYLMFATNNIAADQIRYFDGTTWTKILPVISGANTLQTALMIFPFKGRLVALNPVIGGVRYPNRAQFSIDGDLSAANDANSWLQTAGEGGFTQAATREAIVGAAFLHDRLIVNFERSTWELAKTGNHKLPFVWRKINTELGVESTFSPVSFDKAILGIGNVGIHASNGAGVERVDEKIPQEIFRFQNSSSGPERVYGIRDFNLEMTYWTYPDEVATAEFPNKVMLYNYENRSWGINDDSITCFGHWQKEDDDIWQNDDGLWQDDDTQWNKGALQKKEQHVIAGNQQGWTFFLQDGNGRNSPALLISNINEATSNMEIIDHNITNGDFILIENLVTADPNVALNDKIFQVTRIDEDNVILNDPTNRVTLATGYKGGGTVTRVSRMEIWTKEFSFYAQEGYSNALLQGDFLVDRTDFGEVTVDVVPSASNLSLITEATGKVTDPLFGTSILETAPYPTVTLEAQQTRFWHSVYFSASGETVQLRITLTDEQMIDNNIALSNFVLNAMILYAQKIQVLGG